MKAGTKEAIEAGAIVLAVVGVAWIALRPNVPAVEVPPITATNEGQPNTPIDHVGEAGSDYFNYNYPVVQGLPIDLSGEDRNGPSGCAPTCGCSDVTLLGDNAEFQRYLQDRLTGFVDQYAENVLSFLPSWFRQYLYITGPGLSHLPPIQI